MATKKRKPSAAFMKASMINADAALQEVFRGKKKVSMFEMTSLVSKHLK